LEVLLLNKMPSKYQSEILIFSNQNRRLEFINCLKNCWMGCYF
jgi:hypothetical protein